ncbi:MAG: hypothetical protein MR850_01255 [Bacteroidales bacterium]|nr:hypothetical protein [Bacteroidales bacterium]
MRHLYNILIALAVCIFAATSCIEDSFTYSSSDLLEFSCDTLSFDTIFTEFNTPTHQFVVYNRHKKQIKISSITLGSSNNSNFYIGVDAMKGKEFHDVTIRGGDSIYIFVESRISANGQNTPLRVEDKINFVTNGVPQQVVLRAWGQDVQRIYRTQLTSDTHFTNEKPYVLFDTLFVEKGATLTIDAGAVVYFHDKAAMKVDGTLIANGTQQAPIDLRGDRTDYLFKGANYDIMSGQWGGIEFTENSYGNEMSYVNMRGSSNGVSVKSANTDKRALHIFNSVLRNSSGSVLTAENSWIEAEGCEICDAKKEVLNITGGKHHYINCTFGNYYLFGIRSSAIIGVTLKDADNNPIHPTLTFDNCIISGNISELSQNAFDGESIIFRNCMLRSKGSDDNNFLNCRWGGDAKFKIIRDKYIFDYRLGNDSEAIAVGDPSLCPDFAATDRYGEKRIYNGSIDAGAYRWIETVDENNNK